MKKQLVFDKLSFDDFREMAVSNDLSRYEKVGFPDAYRAGQEEAIFRDLEAKLPVLTAKEALILDIGCGCSDLPLMLIARARSNRHSLVLIDSAEMLSQLPNSDEGFVRKVPAKYPDCDDFLVEFQHRVDAIIVYSVIQYVFADGNVFDFIDKSLSLLAPNGRMLIGDIPNISMRKRFFASENGIRHHQNFTGTNEVPDLNFNKIEAQRIDDSIVVAIVSRVRAAGFHAFTMPQSPDLPMANRREDILVIRP